MKRFLLVATATLGIPAAVQVAPGVHHLVFARLGPAHAQLFIANSDGTDEQAVLPLTGLDYSPALTSDGPWVVFTSERHGSADLYRVHPDGSSVERLTSDPAYDDQAAVSPDGQTIAFVSTRANGKANIWVLEIASKRSRLLTPGAGNDFRPAWSPDGQWIAFTSDRNSQPARAPGAWEHLQSTRLFVVRKDGSGLRANFLL